ncbi:MAG: hypothetical protein KDD22_07810, partial [Bdellovibrionales bacterium]|nr:hypothetical protein [Bdellovibrionales bacterium]
MTITTLLLYLIFQFLLCVYVSQKVETESDYLVGGRNFTTTIVSVSLFATWFGAETCIGSSGAVYAQGLSGSRADPLGYSMCLLLSGLLIAPKLWNQRYMTLSDFYKERFGSTVEQVAVWILSLSSLIWAAAQLRAFGQVISATTDLNIQVTLFLGFAFVVGYTLLGGLMGDMVTDLVQGIVMALGLIMILVAILWNTPDLGHIIKSIPAERLHVLGDGESLWACINRWAIPVFGSLVAQEIVARILSSKTSRIAVRSCYISAGIYLFLGSIPVFLGLIGPTLLPNVESSEHFLIELSQTHLSPILVGIFSGALISALLATIDSILLSVGALVSHNFLIPRFNIRTEAAKVKTSRIVVFAAGLVAYLLAIRSSGILELLEIASSFGTA